MSDRMSDRLSDRIPDRMPDKMSEGMSRYRWVSRDVKLFGYRKLIAISMFKTSYRRYCGTTTTSTPGQGTNDISTLVWNFIATLYFWDGLKLPLVQSRDFEPDLFFCLTIFEQVWGKEPYRQLLWHPFHRRKNLVHACGPPFSRKSREM